MFFIKHYVIQKLATGQALNLASELVHHHTIRWTRLSNQVAHIHTLSLCVSQGFLNTLNHKGWRQAAIQVTRSNHNHISIHNRVNRLWVNFSLWLKPDLRFFGNFSMSDSKLALYRL